MPKQVRVNVRTKVNKDMIRRETRNGREVYVVRSATMPAGIVMNGVKYSGEEIERSYRTLEGAPAPLGHPMVNGSFVPAMSPEGLAVGYIGAHNANVKWQGNRVTLDKIIDIKRANESEGGRRVLEALGEGHPIHTSTGLLAYIRGNDAGEQEAYDIEFDHDAILLDEAGAATPEQGVGMMVNSEGDKIEVVNASIDEDFSREVEWAVDSIVRAAERAEERQENRPLIERIKSAIMKAISLERETENLENGDSGMTEVTKEQFDELSAKVNALAEVDVKAVVAEAISPLTDALKEQKEAAANADAAEKAKLVDAIVAANKLTKETAEALPLSALKELVNTAKLDAAPIAPGMGDAPKGEFKNDWEDA